MDVMDGQPGKYRRGRSELYTMHYALNGIRAYIPTEMDNVRLAYTYIQKNTYCDAHY